MSKLFTGLGICWIILFSCASDSRCIDYQEGESPFLSSDLSGLWHGTDYWLFAGSTFPAIRMDYTCKVIQQGQSLYIYNFGNLDTNSFLSASWDKNSSCIAILKQSIRTHGNKNWKLESAYAEVIEDDFLFIRYSVKARETIVGSLKLTKIK